MAQQPTIEIRAQDKASLVIGKVRRELSSIGSAALGAVGSLGRLVSVVPIAGQLAASMAAVGFAVTRAVAALDDIDKQAQAIGIAADRLSALQIAARQSGLSVEEFAAGMGRLSELISNAAAGDAAAAKLFSSLGISLRNARGQVISADEALAKLADRFQSFADGAQKVALARDIFGDRIGGRFVPLLNSGREALDKATGATKEQIEAAVRAQSAIEKLSAAYERLKLSVQGWLSVQAVQLFGLQSEQEKLDAAIEKRRRTIESLQEELGAVASSGWFFARGRLSDLSRELAAQQAELDTLLETRRLLGRAEAAKSTDIPRLSRAEKQAKDTREAISSAQQALASFVAQLEQDIDRLSGATPLDRFERMLRAFPEIDTAQVREMTSALVEQIEALRAEAETRELVGAALQEEQRRRKALFDQVQELSGMAEEMRKVMLTEELERQISVGILTDPEKIERAVKAIAGLRDQISDTAEVADRMAVAITSSLGRFIETGGSLRNLFRALLEDIAKLIVQMLVLQRLQAAIKASSWFQWLSGAAGAAGGGGGTAAATMSRQSAGTTVSITYNIESIGSNVSRADLVAAMQATEQSTIARLQDLQLRGAFSGG